MRLFLNSTEVMLQTVPHRFEPRSIRMVVEGAKSCFMSEDLEWEYYTSAGGRSPVRDEIAKAKLSKKEAESLAKLLTRYAQRRSFARDVKHLKQHDLYELRLAADHRSFRIIFVRGRKGGLIILALVFVEKKSDKLPPTVFEKAIQRRDRWDERERGLASISGKGDNGL